MHHLGLRLSLLLALLCAACEFRAGSGDFDWDDDDDAGFWGRPDAQVQPSDDDAGTTTSKDSSVGDKTDAYVDPPSDAAVVDAGTDAGETPDDPTLTADDVAAVLARGSCGALEDCMGSALLLDSLDGKDCVEYRTRIYADRELYWLKKSIALERVTFRPAFLAACERDLIARGCDVQSRRLPQSCQDALEGTADLDEACAIDQECEGTAFCDKGMLATCPGYCAQLQTAGLPCTASSQCADGLICRGQVCSAPSSEGDECSTLHGYGECPPGLVCQSQTGTSELACQSIATVHVGKLGDACDATGQLCQLGLVCQSQSSGTAGKCAAPVAASTTCRRSFPSQCPSHQYCKDARANVSNWAAPGTDGICSDLPGDGQECDAAIGCKPGAVCLDDGSCHDLRSVGAACEYNQECYSGSCQNDKCAAPLDCNQ